MGIPGADGAQTNAGAVTVIRGGRNGLRGSGSRLWTQNTKGVPGAAIQGAAMGSALAAGDLNGDGFSDLAIGVPKDRVAGNDRAGSVIVLYGSSRGLRHSGNDRWTQDSTGVQGVAARDNRFGSALASGDFNGDGFGDLAIGAPDQQVRGRFSAGSVTVLYGSPGGLTALRDQVFTQETSGIGGSAGDLHLFGWSLAASDLGRGGADDLAIGTPLDSVEGVSQAGSVVVLYGSALDGLRAGPSQRWSQDSFKVIDRSETDDLFGWSLAAANLGRSDTSDLAIGVPGEDLALSTDAGAVNVLFGGSKGLSAGGNQFRTQNSNGIAGQAASGDAFGSSLAAADFGLSAFADLAIGVPGEDLAAVPGAGAINVIYGSTRGLIPRGNQLWTRNRQGMQGSAQDGEGFGSALSGAQYGHFGRADLAVGVERHDIASIRGAGAVAVIYGSVDGLRPGGNQLWTRQSGGIPGTAHRGDHFGHAVA